MGVDEELGRLAEGQHGLVTRAQARAAGGTDAAIRHRLTSGRWRRVRPDVFAVAGAPASFEQVVLAACLQSGDAAMASHRTAAALWGLARIPPPDAVDVLTPRGRRLRLDGMRHHRSDLLHLTDVAWCRRVPLTSVARTLVDCAASVGERALGRAVDDALRRDLLDVGDLAACVGRLEAGPGRRLAPLRSVLAERLPREAGGSDGELWVLRTLLAAGLPAPVQEHEVVVGGRRRRLDLAYPRQRVAVEFDGFAVHGRQRSRFDDDRSRQNALVLDRWQVLRFTSASPEEEIVEQTRHALALAAEMGHRAS